MLWLLIDIIRHPLTDIMDYAAGNIDYAICHSILRYYRLRHVSFYCSDLNAESQLFINYHSI